jgi:predicted double-glycine peptidase
MNFYGYKVSEKELIHDGDVEEEGTSFEQIRAIAKIHNFTLRTRQHGSFNAIKKLLKKNIPVLVDYQSGSNTGQDGHYTVVVGLDLFYIWLADSSNYVEGDLKSKFVPINRMRKTTFLEHWWDTDADLPTGKVIGWYGVLKPMEI